MSYKEELINLIEPNFIFSNKPINRLLKKTNFNSDNINKSERIKDLINQINTIQNCNIRRNSKNPIFGDGNINSPIMIVGEAPGIEEEKMNKTFQGESGKLLEKMLLAIELKKKNIYSSYAVNFRPPQDRKPTSQEIKRYSVFLKELISIINPRIIILFGSTAMESLISSNDKVSKIRGQWREIILKNKSYPLMVTYSPSYLIRFPENKKFSWEDLKKIRKKILDLNLKIQ